MSKMCFSGVNTMDFKLAISEEIAAALKDIDMEALTLEDIIRQALKRMMK